MLKIKDFEDYLIDKKGNIFSVRKNKYLKWSINRDGYAKVTLHKNKYKKMFSVHRLVAQTFIPNVNNLPQINHKDGNKLNNNVNNLEWCTAKHNMNEAVRIGLFENARKINRENAIKNNLCKNYILANKKTKKKVNKYDKEKNFLETYESITEASKQNNIPISSISFVCKNKRKTAGGFIWHYA